MNILRWIVLLLFVLIDAALADDAPQARLEARFEPDAQATVGMPARLVVDIWVTSWFMEAPQLPALEIAGAVVALTDSAQHLNDKSGSQPWFGIEREYLVTPTQEGELQIPAFDIAVKPGPDGKPVALRTQPLTLHAAALIRPVAAGNSLISTQLQLGEKFDRDLKTLKAGDSFTRTITLSAAGAPAMLLPPVEFAPIDGLAIYPAPPVVANLGDERGGFTGGRRVDSVTYVVQKAGRYTLPPIEVQWWNPQTQALHTAQIAATHFRAAANPATQSEFAIPGNGIASIRSGGYLLASGAAILVLLALYRWLRPSAQRLLERWQARYAQAKQRYENSEHHAYRQLRSAAQGGDPNKFYTALNHWIARSAHHEYPTGPESFASHSGDPQLRAAIAKLEAMLFSDAPTDLTIAATVMKQVDVQRHKRRAKTRTQRGLQPLNP